MIKEQIEAVKIQLETVNNMMEYIPNAKFIVFFVVGFFISWFFADWIKKFIVLGSMIFLGFFIEFFTRKKTIC